MNNRKVRSSSFPKFISNTQKYLVKLARNLQYEKVRKKYNLIAKRLENQIKRNIRKRENKILKQSKSEYLRFIAAKSRPRLSYPVITSDSGVNFFTPIEKSTAFLNHFKSFYQNPLEVKPIPTTCMDPLFDHGLIFMTDFMVYEDMKKLQPKINPRPDSIPQILLKKCATSLSKPVAYLLRLSFLQGKVPLYWKKSIIVPLFKGKNLDKSSPNSYRPVALTSPIAKMAERCIITEIKAFLDYKKVIPPYKHGFRSHKTVISLLLEEIDDLTAAVESNKCADILFFDVSKAFDSVNLDLLIQKISNFGIGNSTITWLQNFLMYRKFSVLIDNTQSEYIQYNQGVPQGSILGPFLYNLYVADMLNEFVLPENLKIKQYADDIQAYSIFDPNHSAITSQSFNTLITHIIDWGKENGLKFASEKFQLLHIGNNNPTSCYQVNDITIHPSQLIRNLGLWMTPDLKWNTHISIKSSAAIRRWFNLT